MKPKPRPVLVQEINGVYAVTYTNQKQFTHSFKTDSKAEAERVLGRHMSLWLIKHLHGFVKQQEHSLSFYRSNPVFKTRVTATGKLNSLFTALLKLASVEPVWLAVELQHKILPIWTDSRPGSNSVYFAAANQLTTLITEFISEYLPAPAPVANPFNQSYDRAY